MKPFDNPNKKTYCYKGDWGPVVETGFQEREGFFYVCTNWKEEISENLKRTIEDRQKGKEDDSQLSLFGEYLWAVTI